MPKGMANFTIPFLLVKSKEENVNTKELLLDLEEPLHRLKCAVNAVELMMYGLGRVRDPYADGFFVIWNCLQEAEEDI